MKKNMTMRIASVLMVLTLLSTCAISGTFAKYVTSATANDTARVAKWGVQVATETNTFDSTYVKDGTDTFTYSGTHSVDAADDKDVVAPGTASTEPFTFSVKGTPEVAVNVKITLDAEDALKMITLPVATYTDYTQGSLPEKTEDLTDAQKFTTSSIYYPIKWTLKRNDTAVVTDENLEAVEAELVKLSKNYDPNTDLGEELGNFELTWKWDYYIDDNTDKMDTYLGQVADNTSLLTGETTTNVLLTEAFKLNITVTQID